MPDAIAPAQAAATPDAGGAADVKAAQASMKATFAEAVAQNAEITKIQTQGNTAKRAASAAPN